MNLQNPMKQIIKTIERSIEIAKELNVNKYTIVRDEYSVSVKLNNKK